MPLDYARALVERIAGARRKTAAQVGLGVEQALDGYRLSGSELVLGSETVALSVFPAGRA